MSPIDLAPESHTAAALLLPELTVVVPTFNERANIPILVDRLAVALSGIEWEVMFVDDDSPDGTAALAKRIGASNQRVRCIRRIGRRGLSGATIEGILASHAPYVAVMDADLQHDEALLAEMLGRLRSGNYDLIIGSRYTDRGSAEGLSRQRRAGSGAAALLVQRILGVQVSDPISGFFMLRRELFEDLASRLSNEGFKILADILISARVPLRMLEVPYHFRERVHGTSKLDSQVALDFVGLLFSKATGSIVPIRFVSLIAAIPL